MPPPLFVTPFAMRCRANPRPHVSTRRPFIILCAATSPKSPDELASAQTDEFSLTSEKQLGDPQWMQLAKEIAPSDTDETPTRPPPKWTFSDGDPSDVGNENPWKLWNAAKEEEEQLTERDLKAETDFWRAAARDVVPDTLLEQRIPPDPVSLFDEIPELEDGPFTISSDSTDVTIADGDLKLSPFNVSPIPAPLQGNSNSADSSIDTISTDEPEVQSSEHVWKMARGITGDMTSLQNQLHDELVTYDADHKRDQYRDMARELVGPTNDEPWEDKDPVRRSDQDDVGAGWNPDVDWMRYDDVGREKSLSEAAAQRRAVEDAARQTMRDALDEDGLDSPDAVDNGYARDMTLSDADPPIVSEQPKDTESGDSTVDSGTFTDQNPASASDIAGALGGIGPGFSTNRTRSSSLYGADWSGAQQEIEELQQQGIDSRDAKSDTDSWRAVAREVVITTSHTDGEESGQSAIEAIRDAGRGDETSSEDEGGEATDVEITNEIQEGGLWSLWRNSAERWERVNEKVAERDPKKEVNMWRASARELTSDPGGASAEMVPQGTPGDANMGGMAVSPETSVWEQWREANEQWEKTIVVNEVQWAKGQGGGSAGETSGDGQKIDWGAGLGKTNSERSAWDNWSRVSGQGDGEDDKNVWWRTRLEGVDRNLSGGTGSGRNSPSAGILRESDERVSGERGERLGMDSSVNAWRSMAKELSSESDDGDVEEEENEEDPSL